MKIKFYIYFKILKFTCTFYIVKPINVLLKFKENQNIKIKYVLIFIYMCFAEYVLKFILY
jgi:hypothetical protein